MTSMSELRLMCVLAHPDDESLLDYEDGSVDYASSSEAVRKIAAHLQRVRPHVVISFSPDGAYGHPDHIAISQLTTAAVVAAAGVHQVAKLYQIAWSEKKWSAYQA